MFQIFIVFKAKIKGNIFPLKYATDRFYNREDQGRQIKKLGGRSTRKYRKNSEVYSGRRNNSDVNCITEENVRYRIYDK